MFFWVVLSFIYVFSKPFWERPEPVDGKYFRGCKAPAVGFICLEEEKRVDPWHQRSQTEWLNQRVM